MKCNCGNNMVLKLARKGETKGNFFWGCANYPQCQFTKEYVIPENRFDFANNDFTPIISSLNEKSKSEQETIETEIKVQMIQILEHFIACTWGSHFNTMFDKLIKPYLKDSVTLDYVLRGDSIKETKGNVIRGNTGAKIYPQLYEYLITVNSSNIINYLETEFKNFLQHKTTMEDKFEKVMSLRTNEELIKIVTLEKDDYNPIAIETAEKEIQKRNIDTSNFDKIQKEVQTKKETKKKFESNIADSGTRFLNSIIDSIVWLILLVLISVIFFTFIEVADKQLNRYSYILTFGTYFTYYIFMETLFQKTVGKLITKTKVVKSNGEKPGAILIIARTFSRFIPFDGLTFLFQKKGLHDILSKTRVIKDKQKTEKEK